MLTVCCCSSMEWPEAAILDSSWAFLCSGSCSCKWLLSQNSLSLWLLVLMEENPLIIPVIVGYWSCFFFLFFCIYISVFIWEIRRDPIFCCRGKFRTNIRPNSSAGEEHLCFWQTHRSGVAFNFPLNPYPCSSLLFWSRLHSFVPFSPVALSVLCLTDWNRCFIFFCPFFPCLLRVGLVDMIG